MAVKNVTPGRKEPRSSRVKHRARRIETSRRPHAGVYGCDSTDKVLIPSNGLKRRDTTPTRPDKFAAVSLKPTDRSPGSESSPVVASDTRQGWRQSIPKLRQNDTISGGAECSAPY